MKTIYFVILARSHNDVGAIAEAHKLAKVGGTECRSVEVRTCGTKELIAHVFPDGAVRGLASNRVIADDVPSQPGEGNIPKEIEQPNRFSVEQMRDELSRRVTKMDDSTIVTVTENNNREEIRTRGDIR